MAVIFMKKIMNTLKSVAKICERYGWARISCADENGVKSRETINAEVFAAINGVLGIE